ncbi:hypothetical protein E2320_018523, partial [Naja naja]
CYEQTSDLAKMNFEELLREVGGFGRFQILTLLLLCFPRLLLPLHFLMHNFLAAIPGHHCAIPYQQQFANLTKEEVLIINIPRDFNGAFSSCEMFSEPQFHLLFNSSLELTNVSVQSCQYGWIYDQSQFISTIATQWNLVCEHKSLNQATATFFFFGVMFGAVIFGDLSDRFGRKRMLLVSYLGTLIFGVLSSASVSYSMFAVTWTLTGVSICGLSIIVIPLGKPKRRFRFGAAFSYYNMSMNITGFGLGMYMTQFVFGFIEVPAKLLVFVIVNRVGRRKSQAWVLILSGLSVGINTIVPTSSIFPLPFLNYSSKGKKHLHGDAPDVAPLQLSHN